ncbi:hypothetical protein ACP4OV_013049 [Aristida adscensionis]
MRRSGRLALVMGGMDAAAQELRDELRYLAAMAIQEEDESSNIDRELDDGATPAPAVPPLVEALLPLFTAASQLLEICTRAEGVAAAGEVQDTRPRQE